MVMRVDINYRTDPKLFSNRAILSTKLVRQAAAWVVGDEPITLLGLLSLAVIAEHAVLNEGVILASHKLAVDGEYFLGDDSATESFAETLSKGGVIELDARDSPGNIMNHELSMLTEPQQGMRVATVHDSHIFYEWDPDAPPDPEADEYGLLPPDGWSKRAERSFDPAYIEELKSRKLYSPDRMPWRLVANCHGISYCSSVSNALRIGANAPHTTIGLDLYRRLEELHSQFFQSIRRYLGPTYVRLPSMLTIVLGGCKDPADIPDRLISTRERFQKFRKQCTQLELDLRTAESVKDQVKVVLEIDRAYDAIAKKVAKPKTRVIYRAYDVVKNLDPVRMGLSLIDQAKEYDIECQSRLRIPGYYDLWNASLEVQQSVPLLQRLFGEDAAHDLAHEYNMLQQTLSGRDTIRPPST